MEPAPFFEAGSKLETTANIILFLIIMMEEDNEHEQQRVTADTYGALDTTAVNDDCWMIRVPPKLAELWENAQEGTELGELVFTKGGNLNGKTIKPSLTVHVSESLVDQKPAAAGSSGKLPLNYSLQAMTKKIPVMHPFVRNPHNGSVELLGTVTRTANLQVEQDSSYRAMLKDRLVTTNLTTNRFVKPVEATESILTKQQRTSSLHTKKKNTFGDAVYKFGQRMNEITADAAAAAAAAGGGSQQGPSKKARKFAPDQPLRSVIFELFGQQPFWTIKDLKTAAVNGGCSAASGRRAETEIRDILRNEIGDYHRSGDNKNKWELRKEFQQQNANK